MGGWSVACLQQSLRSLARSPLPPPLKGHYRLETLASAYIVDALLPPPSFSSLHSIACIAANKVFNIARGIIGDSVDQVGRSGLGLSVSDEMSAAAGCLPVRLRWHQN